jgi:hypothetical protein
MKEALSLEPLLPGSGYAHGGQSPAGFPHPVNDASTQGNFAEQESLNYNADKNAFS